MPPTEAALLRLLRVKCCLLSLHPLNQMFDPIKDRLIRDAGRHETVMLNLPVDLVALLTHDPAPKAAFFILISQAASVGGLS